MRCEFLEGRPHPGKECRKGLPSLGCVVRICAPARPLGGTDIGERAALELAVGNLLQPFVDLNLVRHV